MRPSTRLSFLSIAASVIALFGVCQPAEAANIARVISLRAGIPESVPAVTVHRNCASGFEAVTTAWERMASWTGTTCRRHLNCCRSNRCRRPRREVLPVA